MKRAIILVIDSLGIGAMEDVVINRKQDEGSNTLRHVLEKNPRININNLQSLGIINALGEEVGQFKKSLSCIYGQSKLCHYGADSFYGHYEIAGSKLKEPFLIAFSYYIKEIRYKLIQYGYKVDIGEKIGIKYLIVNDNIIISDNLEGENGQLYTILGSKYSDFAEVNKIGEIVRNIVKIPRVVVVKCNISMEELKACIEVRNNEYIGINAEKCGLYNRGYKVRHLVEKISEDNHCVSNLLKCNIPVVLIGKVSDILGNEDSKKIPAVNTDEIISKSLIELQNFKEGLIFINIQETDLAGHLQNERLYGQYLEKTDIFIGNVINYLTEDDFFIITADHGNDPCIGHSKHTREIVPILIYKKSMEGNNLKCRFLGCRETLSDIGATICEYFNVNKSQVGHSFYSEVEG